MIVTQSKRMRDLIKLAKRVGRSRAPVLLTGESGTGKELFAHLIHAASQRSQQRYVTVNCASLPKDLVESELFGHEKGSFTDAVSSRVGRFELAEGGTLLLDEVSEIPTAIQAKLLRVLEANQFERVGSSESIHHDVRILASSNRPLREDVAKGHFRLDLYHRLNVIEIHIPPLRERIEDLPILAMHFVEKFREENEAQIRGLDNAAMQLLAKHEWPGNVRELRNVIHRACILTETELIPPELLNLDRWNEISKEERSEELPSNELPHRWLETELAEIEREVILAAVEKYGNQRVVAEKLGVSQRTLTNKMRQYREVNVLPMPRREAA
ncbi:MAG: sigma-54 dependent transcriptional regulator [Planctomycetota bacterium]